jgi:hypothetical protein
MTTAEAGLRVPGWLTAIARGGRCIEVWPAANTDPRSCVPAVTGSLLAAVLVQRGLEAIHGTVVARDGRGVLIVGATASGKSEVALGLVLKEWQLVSDDLTVLELNRERVTARSGRSVLDLWPSTLRRWDAGASIGSAAPSGKVSVDVAFVQEPDVIVDAVVLLVVHNGDVSVYRPPPVAAVDALLRACYWRHNRVGTGASGSRALSVSAALVNSCKVFAIRHSRAPSDAYRVVDAMRECAGW